ncbi:MAG TPA: helicase-related protein [Chthoniobacterales bacterium]|nr:helicase-related protein [Chthoniobacterales bacterium]
MQHDIIDNRERKLAASVKPLLSESDKAKFAVGYFFISGFKFIADELEKISELRLLIGNVSDSRTIEQLAETHSAAQLLDQTRKREFANQKERQTTLDEVGAAIRLRIEQLSQTDEDERVINLLLKLIEEKRFIIRVYTKSRLHAKAYIFDYPTERYDRGMAIIGSSNLSLSGLVDNTELNVEVHGKGNHEQLTKWFNDLWGEAEDFDADLMRELRASWALNSITPFELYVKVLFELVRDRLEHPLQAMPSDFPPLTDFQWAAVQSALRILKRQNGVILGDVVGFGKTLMGTALLKWLHARERWRALIICPKQLRSMWEKYNNEYGLRAKVLTLGQIRSPNFDWAILEDFEPRLALVDESHNFRHSDTEQYKQASDYLRKRGLPVICLTATPRNRLAKDVFNQIALFHPEDAIDLGVTPPSLSKYFRLVDKHEREMPPLLQHFMVRRTRTHIREHWPNAQINGRKLIFPDRKLTTIKYNINKAYNGLYDKLRRLIEPPNPKEGKTQGLRYARYGLIDYVDAAMRSQSPYKDLARAGLRLSGLMRSLLFKRLESSVEAFRCTVSHLLESHRLFLALLKEGKISAGEDVEPLLKDLEEGDAEDEDLLESLRGVSAKYDIKSFDRTRLEADITNDVHCLQKIRDAVEPITPAHDAKLQRLIKWLDEESLLRQHKLLVFTQFSDTGEYLYKNLRSKYRNLEFADSKRSDLTGVVRRFAPIANNVPGGNVEQPIQVLIATDVLSEGLNLQDAAYILNYDLHWNPVRLIQRFGRIDRLNTLHREIYAFNFLPDPKLDDHLGIEQTLRERIAEIHTSIGEDAPILDPEEQLNEKAMYAIYEGDGKALESLEEADADYDSLGIQSAEDFIRKLEREEPEFMAKIKRLPNALRTGRKLAWPQTEDSPLSKLKEKPAIFFFGKAAEFQKLYLADEDGKILAEDQMEAIAAIRCSKEETPTKLPSDYNALVEKLRAQFEKAFADHLAAGGLPHRLSPPVRRAVDEIQKAFIDSKDEEIKNRLAHLRELFRLPLDARTEGELRDWRRTISDDPQVNVERLTDIAFSCKLDDLWIEQARHTSVQKESVPIIICTEALV